MKLSFHGADRDVTGSCHLIEVAGKRILIDCGLFQGSRELEEENAHAFGFDPASIDIVLLTHAHLDHCGRLPLLAKRGFSGEIIATAATAELARLVMVDSAHLQEEDARFKAKKAKNHPERVQPPLYTIIDALNAAARFGRVASYDKPITLAPGLTATFSDAGHILGSASILLTPASGASVLFSGDLGKVENPLLAGPTPPPRADVVVMETTYGNRDHKSLTPSIQEFYKAVTEAFQRGGNVVIPTFAMERAQEILYLIAKGLEGNLLPPQTAAYLDSPMAISVTEIMARNPALLKPEIAAAIAKHHDPFHFGALHLTRDKEKSQDINAIKSHAIILAGSGMCTGGRVRHHLLVNLPRPESAIVFVGYAAGGTLARRIIDGAKLVRIFGEEIAVKASIHTINGFSAHAGHSELLAWQKQTGAARTFLVHGEDDVMHDFAKALTGTKVEMPTAGQEVVI
jgi:metallo-beta-lactamase family protein